MAKFKSIKEQMRLFNRKIKSVLTQSADQKTMKAVGEFTLDIVKQEARRGNDYKGGKFKALSESYKKMRAQKKRKRKYAKGMKPKALRGKVGAKNIPYVKDYKSALHETARPRKSNVTATGQMIESLKVVNPTKESVDILPTGTRSRTVFDGPKGKILTNKKVAEYVAAGGRHFLGVSERAEKKIKLFYKRLIKAIIRKNKKPI